MLEEMTATLGEGRTPLVRSQRLARQLGVSRLYFKLESTNPSGSYKDRFVAAEMTAMLAAGARACVATSSGNTGSALAAYCARYDVRCAIMVNEAAPEGKLSQMRAHGARVIRVKGFGADAAVTEEVFRLLAELAREDGVPLVVSAYRHCPTGMAGVESLGRELREQAGPEPHHVFVPVGGGGLYTATARGLAGSRWPVHVVQPEGCLTVAAAWRRGDREIRPVQSTTRISGLSVPFDIDASLALEHLLANGGAAFAVSDDEVYECQRLLLTLEGIFAEPAGATALAGLRRALAEGRIQPGDPAICLVTGTGFKDPESVAAAASAHPDTLLPAAELRGFLRSEVLSC